MGFKIAVGFPSVYAVSFFAVERNVLSIFHESFLNTVYFSHAYIEHAGDLLVFRVLLLKSAPVAVQQN